MGTDSQPSQSSSEPNEPRAVNCAKVEPLWKVRARVTVDEHGNPVVVPTMGPGNGEVLK